PGDRGSGVQHPALAGGTGEYPPFGTKGVRSDTIRDVHDWQPPPAPRSASIHTADKAHSRGGPADADGQSPQLHRAVSQPVVQISNVFIHIFGTPARLPEVSSEVLVVITAA